MNPELFNICARYCDTITTKEVSEKLKITMTKAKLICEQAVKDGWLCKYGYVNPKKRGEVFDISQFSKPPKGYSLTWQNIKEN